MMFSSIAKKQTEIEAGDHELKYFVYILSKYWLLKSIPMNIFERIQSPLFSLRNEQLASQSDVVFKRKVVVENYFQFFSSYNFFHLPCDGEFHSSFPRAAVHSTNKDQRMTSM